MTIPQSEDLVQNSSLVMTTFTDSRTKASKRMRKSHPPSKSVSPSNQVAGLLFRMSEATVESICIGGGIESSSSSSTGISTSASINHNSSSNGNSTFFTGSYLPPSTKDYGFSYAAKERLKHQTLTEASMASPSTTDTPDNNHINDEDCDYQPEAATVVVVKSSNKSKRTGGHPPAPRHCISCGATKTPYWREAWSNAVLLCNACGLRFSKFRRRCLDCSYVPRKEDKGSRACTKCGGPWS